MRPFLQIETMAKTIAHQEAENAVKQDVCRLPDFAELHAEIRDGILSGDPEPDPRVGNYGKPEKFLPLLSMNTVRRVNLRGLVRIPGKVVVDKPDGGIIFRWKEDTRIKAIAQISISLSALDLIEKEMEVFRDNTTQELRLQNYQFDDKEASEALFQENNPDLVNQMLLAQQLINNLKEKCAQTLERKMALAPQPSLEKRKEEFDTQSLKILRLQESLEHFSKTQALGFNPVILFVLISERIQLALEELNYRADDYEKRRLAEIDIELGTTEIEKEMDAIIVAVSQIESTFLSDSPIFKLPQAATQIGVDEFLPCLSDGLSPLAYDKIDWSALS